MGISVREGIQDLTNSAQDVLDAPAALVNGDTDGVVDAVKAPFEVKRGVIKTVLGAAAEPFRAIGLFGGNQNNPSVQQGTQAAVERYL